MLRLRKIWNFIWRFLISYFSFHISAILLFLCLPFFVDMPPSPTDQAAPFFLFSLTLTPVVIGFIVWRVLRVKFSWDKTPKPIHYDAFRMVQIVLLACSIVCFTTALGAYSIDAIDAAQILCFVGSFNGSLAFLAWYFERCLKKEKVKNAH